MKKKILFQTEIKQLLKIVINSLYKNDSAFIRELISNASDAAEKLRFNALTNVKILEDSNELSVAISLDKINNSIIIEDNCIGMTYDEVINNLGTIAKSGTKDFIKKISEDLKCKNSNLIGNFGMGFYSTFVVANKIVVETRKAGVDKYDAVRWISDGDNSFEVGKIFKNFKGTKIIIFLKDDKKEFLEEYKIRNLITKYSNYVSIPVILKKKDCSDDMVNKVTALWRLNKKEISDKEYINFYKKITNNVDNPLCWIHNKVEGRLEYISLLYIPSKVAFDLFLNKNISGLKLYSKKIFVCDNYKKILPNYLRFINGIIDIDNLKLNISREFFQNSRLINNIKNSLIRKILDALFVLSNNNSEKYKIFWENFGQIFKEGLSEDINNKDSILRLFRFSTSYTFSKDQNVSLDDYIKRMNVKQKNTIYYLLLDDFELAKYNPHLEYFNKNNIEVLILTDKIDEWIVNSLFDYNGKNFKSIIKSDLNIDKSKLNLNDYDNMINKMENILKKYIKHIKISNNLLNYPSKIVLDSQDVSPQIEKIMLISGQKINEKKYILELNSNHKIINILKNEKDNNKFIYLTEMIFEQALLLEGKNLKNGFKFINNINDLILKTYND